MQIYLYTTKPLITKRGVKWSTVMDFHMTQHIDIFCRIMIFLWKTVGAWKDPSKKSLENGQKWLNAAYWKKNLHAHHILPRPPWSFYCCQSLKLFQFTEAQHWSVHWLERFLKISYLEVLKQVNHEQPNKNWMWTDWYLTREMFYPRMLCLRKYHCPVGWWMIERWREVCGSRNGSLGVAGLNIQNVISNLLHCPSFVDQLHIQTNQQTSLHTIQLQTSSHWACSGPYNVLIKYPG